LFTKRYRKLLTANCTKENIPQKLMEEMVDSNILRKEYITKRIFNKNLKKVMYS